MERQCLNCELWIGALAILRGDVDLWDTLLPAAPPLVQREARAARKRLAEATVMWADHVSTAHLSYPITPKETR